MIKFKLFPAAVKDAHWNSGIVIPSKFFAQFSTQLYVYLYTSSSLRRHSAKFLILFSVCICVLNFQMLHFGELMMHNESVSTKCIQLSAAPNRSGIVPLLRRC